MEDSEEESDENNADGTSDPNPYQRGFAFDDIKTWKKQNFEKKEKDAKGHRVVDQFLLRIASLVICRGKHSDKTEQYLQTILSGYDAK